LVKTQPWLFCHRRLIGREQHRAGHLHRHITAPGPPVLDVKRLEKPFTHAYQYITGRWGAGRSESSTPAKSSPSKTDQFLIPFIEVISRPEFQDWHARGADQTLLKSPMFACLMEGLFFYVGFTQILALVVKNK
jgi:ribonucleoside-diphosphate reductase beta chain